MSIRITITGDLGSGKSTVCRELNKKFDLQIFSTGTIQRKIAVEMGMSTLDLNKYMETHPEIDQLIDGELVNLSNSADNIAIDSRMAWHFVKNTYDVFLTTDETLAAQRVVSDKRGPSEGYTDVQHAIELLKARKQSENYRYNEKYGVNCYDFSNYDLILDTTDISPDCVAEVIMHQYSQWKPDDKPVFLISPLCLYPTRSITNTSPQTIDEYCSLILNNKPVQPVEIIVSNGFFYIYDGHHRASAFYRLKETLVPCIMIAQNEELVVNGLSADEYAEGEFELAKVHDWEDLNGFKFFTYP
ncbi:MAG: AAA family ATPase [Clostridiales Family XIII bacterium]|jgi:predicted cytidylate kinase|nr:AAA family ATPase [Clostridiales Family XIII bacterium]